MATESLIKAVIATAEVMGTELSRDGARVFCADLSEYPEPAVMNALARARREVRGRLTLSDVIQRIDDGRPGSDEAWAMVPRTEADSVVWTNEMSEAFFSSALPLMEAGDDIAARMAFKQTYDRLISQARNEKRPPMWVASLGFDKGKREAVVRKAVELGRLSPSQAVNLLPEATFESLPLLPSAASLVNLIEKSVERA